MTSKIAENLVARFQLEAMSNLRSRTTGVEGAVIWVSAGEFAGADLQHGPRIKVVLGTKITSESLKDSVSVKLTDPPVIIGTLPAKIKKDVIRFVEANRETLLLHWNGELDSKEMLDQIEAV